MAPKAKIDTSMIKLLPTFAGRKEDNIENFLLQFQEIASLTEWTDEQKGIILRTRLRENALDYILNDENNKQEENFETLSNILTQKFQEKISLVQAQTKFNNIKHKPNMTIESLAKEIKTNTNLFLNCNKEIAEVKIIQNKIMLAKFLETVRSDIKLELKKENIQNFEEAVRRALILEQAFDESTAEINNIEIKENDDMKLMIKDLEIAHLKEQIKEIGRQIRNSTENVPQRETKRCEICKKDGHSIDECWYNMRVTGRQAYRNVGQNREFGRYTVNRPNPRNQNDIRNFPIKQNFNPFTFTNNHRMRNRYYYPEDFRIRSRNVNYCRTQNFATPYQNINMRSSRIFPNHWRQKEGRPRKFQNHENDYSRAEYPNENSYHIRNYARNFKHPPFPEYRTKMTYKSRNKYNYQKYNGFYRNKYHKNYKRGENSNVTPMQSSDLSRKKNDKREVKSSQLSSDNEILTVASCQFTEMTHLPVIPVKIKDLEFNSLLDSGAAINLISDEVFEKIKSVDVKITYLSRNVKIHTIQDTVIPFSKTVQFQFKINDKVFKQTFFVTKKFSENYDMILGFEFLKDSQAIIDCAKYDVVFKNDRASQMLNGTPKPINKKSNFGREHIASLHLIQKVSLEPQETKCVILRPSQKFARNTEILITPKKNNTGIMLEDAISVVRQDSTLVTLIHNYTTNKITLNKNMILGQVTCEFQIKNEEKSTKDKIVQINNLSLEEIHELRKQDLTVNDFNVEHLARKDKERVLNLLLENYKAFSKSYKTLGQTSVITPQFKLTHNCAIQTKPYALPHSVKIYAKKELDKLLEAGIIEESRSNYAFPVIFVKKKSSKTDNEEHVKLRMAIDYRLLNQITEIFPYKLPDIREILNTIAGNKLYTALDLHSAFHQILLNPEDKHKLAFTTEFGNFQPNRLPFGAKNSSTYFAFLMQKCLGELRDSKIQFFLDDIIIAADTQGEMDERVRKILQRLQKFNLTIEPSKVQLYRTEIDFLGYTINQFGIMPSDKNVSKITSFPQPKNTKQVKSFLGLCNYFRELIPNYAEVVNPLVNLTSPKTKFKWTREEQTAFEKIQKIIFQKPSTFRIDFDKEFYLITDGSKTAISSILLQDHEGKLMPVEFFSRKIKDSEKRYPSIKLELLAIHNSIMHFKRFLYGKKFTIFSDSKALSYHLKLDKQADITARWLLDLQEFDFCIKHIEGKSNPADFLSRAVFNVPITEKLVADLFKVDKKLDFTNMSEEQHKDEKLSKIIEELKVGKKNKKLKMFEWDENLKLLILSRNKINRQRTLNKIIIVPKSLQTAIIHAAHAAHFSVAKTYELVKRHYYWVGMFSKIKQFCLSCHKCILHKSKPVIKPPLKEIVKDYSPGEFISIDLVGPLVRSLDNNFYILTVIDHYSRFFQGYPLRHITSKSVIEALTNYFSLFGLPKIVLTDNGSQFVSREFENFMDELDIQHRKTSIYFPQSNGLLERTHKTLKESIAAMTNDSFQWDAQLRFFILNYNNTLNRATGFTPAMLYLNRDLRTPFTANMPIRTAEEPPKYVKENLVNSKKSRKHTLINQHKTTNENLKRQANRRVKLEVGDTVYLKNLIPQSSLEPKFSGPFVIKKCHINDNFTIQLNIPPFDKELKIHASKLVKINMHKQDSEQFITAESRKQNKEKIKGNIKFHNKMNIQENPVYKSPHKYNLRPLSHRVK